MDFFEAQERARGRTNRLVFFFVLAVAGTVLVSYIAAMAALLLSDEGAFVTGQVICVDGGSTMRA